MKLIVKYIAATFIAAAVFSSCKKTFDLNPTHTIDGDDFFTNVDDYDFALTGAYQRLKQNSLYSGVNGGSVWLTGPDLAADNLYSGGSANLGNLNTLFRWNYASDEPVVQGAWDAAYLVIQQANLAMRGIDRFTATDATKVNRIEGQARVIRAHMHFELLRWWANDYDRNATSLGIAYVDKFDVEQKPARLTVKESYDKIEADLKAAKAMLLNTDRSIQSTTSTDGTARAYADAMVCDAILARMYLYANQMDSAIKYSSLVIAARPLATDPNEFYSIWEDASTREVIWSVKYQSGNAAMSREIYDVAAERSSWLPVTALLSLYGGSDIRAPSYFSSIGGSIVLTKYYAKTAALANPDGVVDLKLYRTGEMYLIRSEAYARKALGTQALADLNFLRAARGASTGAETGNALLTAIQTERRKELVAEGHRFFDLKRTTRVVSRTQDCSIYCNLPSTNRAWAFPIPRTEMLANPNMVQNTGY